METRPTEDRGRTTQTKDRPAASLRAGAAQLPRKPPSARKSASLAEPALSTSLKTTPKPVTSAGVELPATKNLTSIVLLPRVANVLSALKKLNWASYVAFRSRKSLSLTRRPV